MDYLLHIEDFEVLVGDFDSESVRKVQETIPINLGTEKDPKLVYIGSQCSPFEIARFTELLKEFKDVFSWSYENLKVFDMKEIIHAIPIIHYSKPYR